MQTKDIKEPYICNGCSIKCKNKSDCGYLSVFNTPKHFLKNAIKQTMKKNKWWLIWK